MSAKNSHRNPKNDETIFVNTMDQTQPNDYRSVKSTGKKAKKNQTTNKNNTTDCR